MSNKAFASAYVGESPVFMEAMRLLNQRKLQRENIAAEDRRQGVAGKQSIELEDRRHGNEMTRQRDSQSATEKLTAIQAENERLKAILGQQMAVMQAKGVPYTKENFGVFDQALTDPIIRGHLQRLDMENQVQAEPGYHQAVREGMTAGARMPVADFMNKATVSAQPDSLLLSPDPVNFSPNFNRWNQVQGGQTSEAIVPTTKPMPDGTQWPGDPMRIRQTGPPRIKLPQNILDAAAQQGGRPTVPPTVNPMPMPGMNPGTGGGTNIPPELLQMLLQRVMTTPRG